MQRPEPKEWVFSNKDLLEAVDRIKEKSNGAQVRYPPASRLQPRWL